MHEFDLLLFCCLPFQCLMCWYTYLPLILVFAICLCCMYIYIASNPLRANISNEIRLRALHPFALESYPKQNKTNKKAFFFWFPELFIIYTMYVCCEQQRQNNRCTASIMLFVVTTIKVYECKNQRNHKCLTQNGTATNNRRFIQFDAFCSEMPLQLFHQQAYFVITNAISVPNIFIWNVC